MISEDCNIQPAVKPESGERLCWNVACRRPLPKRARKWCEFCTYGNAEYVQHNFQTARLLVIAEACEEPHHDERGWEHRALVICEPRCANCGIKTSKPEVDHKVPMNGANRQQPDCRNHASNLRVLCHKCHRRVSAVQARARANARKGKIQMELQL